MTFQKILSNCSTLKETITEVRDALQNDDTDRERTYLHYRYGFMDDLPHEPDRNCNLYHLSLSRAKSTERAALDKSAWSFHGGIEPVLF